MEESEEPLSTGEYDLRCSIKPYQILTLRLLPGEVAWEKPG
jgi:hypothetical protein